MKIKQFKTKCKNFSGRWKIVQSFSKEFIKNWYTVETIYFITKYVITKSYHAQINLFNQAYMNGNERNYGFSHYKVIDVHGFGENLGFFGQKYGYPLICSSKSGSLEGHLFKSFHIFFINLSMILEMKKIMDSLYK